MSNTDEGEVSVDDLVLQPATSGCNGDDKRMEELFSKEDEIISRVLDLFPEVAIYKIHVLLGSVTTIYAESNPDNVEDATDKVCNHLLENPELLEEVKESNEDRTFSGGAESNEDRTFSGGAESNEYRTFSGGAESNEDRTFSGGAESNEDHTFIGGAESNEDHTFSGGAESNEDHTFSGGAESYEDNIFSGGAESNENRISSVDVADKVCNYLYRLEKSELRKEVQESNEDHIFSEDTKSNEDSTFIGCTIPKRGTKHNEDSTFSGEHDFRENARFNRGDTSEEDTDLETLVRRLAIELAENANSTSRSIEAPESMYCTCLCCFEDIPFVNMVQCQSGHLFCSQCLESYVKESVFGQGKLELNCMTADCIELFPDSELHRSIPEDLYNKYQERVMEEGVNSADLDNFVRCKSCPYGVVMDPNELFFPCPTCEVAYCRKCLSPREDHRGHNCPNIEEHGETRIRKRYEEKMADAKIRTCGRCKTRFTKDRGCNHIQCRCGASMCYICRNPNVNKKKHYCRHVRKSGRDCYECQKRCYLYTDVTEDEEMAIAELKSEARYVRQMEGYADDKEIGAP